LIPKSGEFEASDVNVKNAAYPFDLVVTIGVANLTELGTLYATHAQMFFEIPIINLDYRAANQTFGQINLVNLTSSSVCEVVYDLISEYDSNFIDEKIATLLLAGLIAQTNNFQSQKTTPQAFMKASKLVSLGGRQQEIITQLYRSKSLGLLRLWGRALARLRDVTADEFVYSAVTSQDIERAQARGEDIDEIIIEMIQQLIFAKVFLFLAESSQGSTVYVASSLPLNPAVVFAAYNPTNLNSQVYKFQINKPIAEAETEAVGTITAELSKFPA
jgi:nanoRNase/pAp phosphatase (c-di-AMP/oligoRNAs hydrolase)